jgi:hypothetical protein
MTNVFSRVRMFQDARRSTTRWQGGSSKIFHKKRGRKGVGMTIAQREAKINVLISKEPLAIHLQASAPSNFRLLHGERRRCGAARRFGRERRGKAGFREDCGTVIRAALEERSMAARFSGGRRFLQAPPVFTECLYTMAHFLLF